MMMGKPRGYVVGEESLGTLSVEQRMASRAPLESEDDKGTPSQQLPHNHSKEGEAADESDGGAGSLRRGGPRHVGEPGVGEHPRASPFPPTPPTTPIPLDDMEDLHPLHFYDQLQNERLTWSEERATLLNVIRVQQEELMKCSSANRERAVEVARAFGDAVGVFEERLIGVEQGVAQEIKLLRTRREESEKLGELEKKLDWICQVLGSRGV